MTIEAFSASPEIVPPAPAEDGPPFSAILRDHTHAVHREAERSGVIADLLRGRATRRGYALYLASLLPAYEAMETALANARPSPILAAFAAPGLARAPALRADLAALAEGADAASRTPPEARAYAAVIDRAAADGPGAAGIGLVAHAYARYLGDLSGGQILKPLVARALGLAPDQLTFYDFPGIADMAAAKADLRRALDLIAPGSPEATIVLDEAIAAFRHTIAVSTAVSAMMVE